jgi:hypothetical protein
LIDLHELKQMSKLIEAETHEQNLNPVGGIA